MMNFDGILLDSMDNLEKFVRLSLYFGERFDLVQAGGGNSSVKLDDGTMLIKASGFSLSDVSLNKGYSKVNNELIVKIIENKVLKNITDRRERDARVKELINKAILDKSNKPSIETFLHSIMFKYTIHIHPIQVNAITCRRDWKEILQKIFQNALFINYKTPGFDLAIELKNEMEKYLNANQTKPKIIFLQNHGLILSSDDSNEIFTMNEEIISKIEQLYKFDLSDYKITNKISALINSIDNGYRISYLSSDKYLNEILLKNREIFFTKPFCPDKLVYCGASAVEIQSINDIFSIAEYQKKYFELPRIIIYTDKIFIISDSKQKAKEIEEVLKFHIMSLISFDFNNYEKLSDDELSFLGNWEAEKYRQKFNKS
ncbi:class II aldolase [Candidatus Poribacteria bacterium]|nr:class II aldolase [Candidatus Poribacteria bacterium]